MSTEADSKIWYLQNLDIFQGLDEAEIMTIADQIEETNYSRNDIIYGPQDPLNHIYIVKRGEVKLYHSVDGKKNVFAILGPHSVFGGIDFTSKESSHFAEATHPTRICIFTEADFKKIVISRPEIMIRVLKKMGGRLKELEDRIMNRTKQADELILQELKRLQIKRSQSLFQLILPQRSNIYITHEELAELTGLNRVTVTRSLKRLKEDQKIDSSNRGIEILK